MFIITVSEPKHSFCSPKQSTLVIGHEGFLGSHVTDKTGCGSPNSPWNIKAKPGQVITFSLIDFGALNRDASTLGKGCSVVFGFIIEKHQNINVTICGQDERKRDIYTSKSSEVEVHVLAVNERRVKDQFLINFSSKLKNRRQWLFKYIQNSYVLFIFQ